MSPVVVTGVFSADGWYNDALYQPAHPGRVGGAIAPEVVTVHTTDTMPGTSTAIINSWSKTPGNGACAHFVLDRAGILTQLISIYRNGNHAGGAPRHGWLVTESPRGTPPVGHSGQAIHPNTLAVGIEVENAGYFGKPRANGDGRGAWIHPDTKRELAAADVQVDARGCGWHKATEVQMSTLCTLLHALDVTLKPMRAGLTIAPNGDYKANMVPWAQEAAVRVHGHVTLDPTNKTDPGPFILARLRAAGFTK